MTKQSMDDLGERYKFLDATSEEKEKHHLYNLSKEASFEK